MWQNGTYFGSKYSYQTLEHGRPLLFSEISEPMMQFDGTVWLEKGFTKFMMNLIYSEIGLAKTTE